MKSYRAVYRCRMCGKEFAAEQCGKNIMRKTMAALALGESYYPSECGIGTHRHDTHECGNGAVGFTDFIGFREVQD